MEGPLGSLLPPACRSHAGIPMPTRWSTKLTAAALCAGVLCTGALAPTGADAIIGGRVAEEGSYPWLAHVSDYFGAFVGECTGTVVAPRLVLTAAHCVVDLQNGRTREPSGFRVVTGNVDWMLTPREVLHVHAVSVAPGFDPYTHTHDAALLVLSTQTTAPAIRLSRPRADASILRAGTPASIVGWGEIRYGQPEPTPELRDAETAVQNAAWCQRNAPPFYASSQLCVIDPPKEATGTCEGDSGGPLIVSAPGEEQAEPTAIELGVLSGGYGHCATKRPSVYTRVDAVYPWIQRWIARLSSH
jgi:secreted trypsin-like serine protease